MAGMKLEDVSVTQLADEFQRVQQSSTKQRLSERNVVEIVTKLVELKLIEVIYTIDGKEYLTPQELGKEIRDELFVHGGRINLVDLQQILNVDFRHIESKVAEQVKHDSNLVLVLGQLVDRSYMDRFAEEVNDKLQDQGHVTIAELTTQYDLPADFLSENVHARLGKIIHGKVDTYDSDVLYTDAFVARMRAQIQGAFSAITRPTLVSSVLHRYGFQERLFFSILEELVSSGRLAGNVSGGRQEKACYIPNIYTKTQNEWVDAFYRQNGYLEYDSLTRLGIQDAKGYIKKRFKSENLTFLTTCCVGVGLKEHVDASVEEALQGNTWVDVMPLLPSIISLEDASQLLSECTKTMTNTTISCHTIISSQQFISKFADLFKDQIAEKAEVEARSNPAVFGPTSEKKTNTKASSAHAHHDEMIGKEEKKEQRKKKAQGATKTGGGTQGREIKTKSLKKKGRGRDTHEDSDDEGASASGGHGGQQEIVFMSIEGITEALTKQPELRDCPDEFLSEIATQLYRPLNKQFHEKAKSIFLTQAGASGGSTRKKTHVELQDKITGLWTNCKLFEKGISFLPEETQLLLVKHLLKTLCSDIVNIVVNAVATDHMMSVTEEGQLSSEGRTKIISKLPGHVQPPLTKLNTSLNGKGLEEFYSCLDVMCNPENLGVLLKKPDKRKERQLVFNHRQGLIEQLNQETDPAMALHLACVILFQVHTQTLVHAPGKCVPAILSFLKTKMEADDYSVYASFQDKVLKHLRLTGENKEEEIQKLIETLNSDLPKVKDIALKSKVQSSAS